MLNSFCRFERSSLKECVSDVHNKNKFKNKGFTSFGILFYLHFATSVTIAV